MATMKTFAGLKDLFKQASKATEENKGKRLEIPTNRRGKKNATPTPVAKSKAAPKPVRKSKEEQVVAEKELLKVSTYAREVQLILDMKVADAIKSIDSRPDSQSNLQLQTARRILVNAMRPDVKLSVQKMLIVQAKQVLLNVQGSGVQEELESIQEFNNFELGKSRKAIDVTGTLRKQLEEIDRSIDQDQFLDACAIINDLAQSDDITRKAERELKKLFELIHARLTAAIENPDFELTRSSSEKATEKNQWKSLVSDIALDVLTFEDREESALDLARLTVNLPITLYSSRIVDGVPIVMSIEGFIPNRERKKHNLRHIVNSVYTFSAQLVGVPNVNDPEKEFERAKKYARKKLNVILMRRPLRRPDSDAVWFPIIPFDGIYVESVGFPDMIGNRENATSEDYRVSQQYTKTVRLRAVREAFEQTEAPLFNLKRSVEAKLSDKRAIITECENELKRLVGKVVNESTIVSAFDKKIEYEINGIEDLSRRWTIRTQLRAQQEKCLLFAKRRSEAALEATKLRAQLKILNEKIHNRRESIKSAGFRQNVYA